MLRLFASAPTLALLRAPADGAPGSLGAEIVGGAELQDGAVSFRKMADMPGRALLGRPEGGSGAPQALTPEEAQRVLDASKVELGPPDMADAVAAMPGPAARALRLMGFAEPGDGGGGLYVRRGAEPVHPGKLQTADGAWWELAERRLTPEMFGAVGDGQTNDRGALLAAIEACSELQAPLHLTSPFGYAFTGELEITAANFTMVGAGRADFNLIALDEFASVVAEKSVETRLIDVLYTGRHPTTGEVVGRHGFVGRQRPGDLRGPNTFTLLRCGTAFTRRAGVVMDRDATEFRIIGGTYRNAGRINEGATGAGRFPDGNVPLIDVAGNGSIEGSVIGGATGYAINVRAGAPDDNTFEEVHVRCINVRVQNGFLGLLRVRDWPGGARTSLNSAVIPVQVVWTAGYMENPGTIQDSTTSGGSQITQTSDDDVTSVLAEGPMTRVSLDGPVKILSRRGNALLRANNGASIDADFRGMMVAGQMLGNTTTDRVLFETRGLNPGTVKLRSLPSIWGPSAANAASLSVLTDWTQIGRSAGGRADRGVVPTALRRLRTVLDGTGAPAGMTTEGLASAAPSSAPEAMLNGRPSLELIGDGVAPSDRKLIRFDVEIPEHWAPRILMIESAARWKQNGATFGDAAGLSHRLRIYDGARWVPGSVVSDDQGVMFPHMAESVSLPLDAPGNGQATAWRHSRAFFQALRPGPMTVEFYLDESPDIHAHSAYVNSIRIFALDGEGADEE